MLPPKSEQLIKTSLTKVLSLARTRTGCVTSLDFYWWWSRLNVGGILTSCRLNPLLRTYYTI